VDRPKEKVTIAKLIDPRSPWSSKRWIGVRSAQALMGISYLLTFAVLYQVFRWRPIDPQLSWLCNGAYGALALLAGAAFWKNDRAPILGEGPTGTTTETTTKTLEVSRDVGQPLPAQGKEGEDL
jgi:hypothetical protein